MLPAFHASSPMIPRWLASCDYLLRLHGTIISCLLYKLDGCCRCVSTLQSKGLKVLCDIVINHRCAQKQDKNGIWNVFGGKMAWDAKAIVLNDRKFKGRGNRATGDEFAAAPNIDHTQGFVRKDLTEWLEWLRDEIGFDGWRSAGPPVPSASPLCMQQQLCCFLAQAMDLRQNIIKPALPVSMAFCAVAA